MSGIVRIRDTEALAADLGRLSPLRLWGEVAAVDSAALRIRGLGRSARRGDRVRVEPQGRPPVLAEIVAIDERGARAMWFGSGEGVAVGDPAWLETDDGVRPGAGWIGRVVDAFGRPIDGRPAADAARAAPLRRSPPGWPPPDSAAEACRGRHGPRAGS
ncbi:MAG: hypothetical protein ACK4WC_15860, partial [Rubrimonas sp.]